MRIRVMILLVCSSTNRLGSVPIEDYGMCGAGAKARTSLALVFRAKEVICVVGLPSFTFLSSVLVGCSCEAHTYPIRGKAISVGPGPLITMHRQSLLVGKGKNTNMVLQ